MGTETKELSKYGNWYFPGTWSELARSTGLIIDVVCSGRKIGTIHNRPNDKDPMWNENVASLTMECGVINDIWLIYIQPEEIRRCIDQEIQKYRDAFASLLSRFGGMNLVYVDGNDEEASLFDFTKTLVMHDGHFLVYTDLKAGMPIREFLLWYKGKDYPQDLLLEEWSNIPIDQMNAAYEGIIELFRMNVSFDEE